MIHPLPVGWTMGMCHQLQGTVKACRAEIGTWTTKWLKLTICREFERECQSRFVLSDNAFLLTVEEKNQFLLS